MRAASARVEAALPPEITFLSRHGVQMNVLRQAAETAAAVGVTADVAALKCDSGGDLGAQSSELLSTGYFQNGTA
jgi:hypothetical protein